MSSSPQPHTLYSHYSSIPRLPYFETSAATGQNVEKAVCCLLDRVMLRMEASVDKQGAMGRDATRLGVTELDEAGEHQRGGCGC